MVSNPESPPVPKAMLWAGYIVSALPALMLTFSGVMKFMPPNDEMIEGLKHVGWTLDKVHLLGIIELVCTALYIIPRTSVLGVILLTGYLGGAIATHLRVGDGFIFQAILGVLVWLGLYLRDARIRALIPLRS